ncbi:hypothetical protein PHMEG_0004822 [Phytophthora megakarya]|uniref:Peptidase A2 domain-containing protein n=1 Tax=Phytophthora megakarya TaxID=4795 RepID=A0A225WUJ0_9STRA|nr:hypothetical protein PHMEG_0004822 [Phytophthora megakarya]
MRRYVPLHTLLQSRCKLCKSVHDSGRCQVFQEIANLVRNKVDKKDIAPELQTLLFGSPLTETGLVPNGLPQLAEPAIEAECAYASAGENESLTGRHAVVSEDDYTLDAGNWVSSVVQPSPQRKLVDELRLLPGERLGWWSTQKFGRRVRMRTLVDGAVDDRRTRILLDTGANVSVMFEKFAMKLNVPGIPDHGRSMIMATCRASVKITLGRERVYVFDTIMDHCAGVEVLLGTDFMITPGVRLDMFHANAKLPGEVETPQIKTQNMISGVEVRYEESGPEIAMIYQVNLSCIEATRDTESHDVWIRRTETLVPTVTRYRKKKPDQVRLTNISRRTVYCSAHMPLIAWVPIGQLPRDVGYVRIDSLKYTEWQVLAYAAGRDKT